MCGPAVQLQAQHPEAVGILLAIAEGFEPPRGWGLKRKQRERVMETLVSTRAVLSGQRG